MRISPVVLIVLLGCSSSSRHARDPRAEQARAERAALEAARPVPPYETRARVGYRANERCGQGPYRIEAESLRARFGEQIVIRACGPQRIGGNSRLRVGYRSGKSETSEHGWGYVETDNGACNAIRPMSAQAVTGGAGTGGAGTGGAGTGGTGGAGTGGGQGRTGTAVAAPSTLTSAALVRVDEIPVQCEYDAQLLDYREVQRIDGIALDAHLVIDLWFEEPNDLDGIVFVVEQRGVVADMTPERWQAFQRDEDAWRARYDAFQNGEVASGRSHWIDSSVTMPPPPPPRAETAPPRPSKNARWVAGYWQWAEGAFHWMAGLWEVPDADIAQDLTVHAPMPPPAAPAEQPKEPSPAASAVWTPGQWQWDGRAYVWIAGSWRIPPSRDHAWTPAGWAIKAGAAIFVPGGWKVRVRLGR